MPMLSRIIAAPRAIFATAAVVVAAGMAVWPLLGTSLLPFFKERDFLMHWLTPPGTSHAEMYRMTVAASKELRSIPGVRNFGAHIGRALVADEVVGIDFTENRISVDPKVDYDKTLKAVQGTVDGYRGIYRDVQTYLRERVKEEVLTGSGESIVVRIFGPYAAVLREERLAKIDFPFGYRAHLLGEAAERMAAQSRLVFASVVAAVVIFMLLQASLRSWRLAALVFLSLPVALIGGVIAAYLGDGIISLGGLVGFLTVLGIAARNGVLLIHHFLHLEHERASPPDRNLSCAARANAFRPFP